MAATIPESFRDLLTTRRAFASLATVMPDQSPHVTPVWCDFDGALIWINTVRGHVKERNMRRHAKVALMIADPDNPYRYLGVQGEVAEITEDGAAKHIDDLSIRYLGEPYGYARPGQVRVLYKIRPERVWFLDVDTTRGKGR